MTACPKPVKRTPRPRKPLRQGKPLERRTPLPRPTKPIARTWMKPGKRKTAHARRERHWGFMAFTRSQPCDVRQSYVKEFRFSIYRDLAPCLGAVQFMHLPLTVGRRRGPDMHGAAGCEVHHHDIDGDVGGKGPWYVALGYEGQQRLRERLRSRSLARWEALTPEARAEWDRMAAEWRASLRRK